MIIPVSLEKDSYDITLERGSLERAGEILALNRKVLVVTDTGVPAGYADKICKVAKYPVKVVIEAGENSKSLRTFERLCRTMLDNGFTRKDCVVAVGGGVVGDLAGFAAACYMRGVDFYNIPTTLLSQVDSSIGGKTAVDLDAVKNIVGAFYQPKAVIIDPDVLKTLSSSQLACGSAEVIKMAMTFDKHLFETIENSSISGSCGDYLEHIIAGALKIKAGVVQQDEKEMGLRKALNFGHTLGHGIESVTKLLHGQCVALGMLPMCSPSIRQRLTAMLQREGLPVECVADPEAVVSAAMHDKKSHGDKVVTVRVREVGSFEFVESSKEELHESYIEVFGWR